MADVDVSLKAEIVGVLGASGSGKSAYMKSELRARKPRRLLIYDPDGEYLTFGRRVEKVGDVLSVLRQCEGGKGFRLIFQPAPDPAQAVKQFDLVCKAAFEAGNLLFLVDELADVTTPSRAPAGWSMVTRRGRKRGITVFGAAQRPANIDKNFLGNCTRVRAGRLLYEPDARAVAAVLGVPHAEFLSLESLHYVERLPPAEAARGVLKFR